MRRLDPEEILAFLGNEQFPALLNGLHRGSRSRIVVTVILHERGARMASTSDFALKHSVATALAIPSTIATSWFLETLSNAGIALVFMLFLAVFNGVAALLKPGNRPSQSSQ